MTRTKTLTEILVEVERHEDDTHDENKDTH